MSVEVSTSEIKLTKTEAGVLRISDARVSPDSVIIAFNEGSAPKEIVYDYDSLTLSEVYAAINCYLQNQKKADSYLAERDKQNYDLRESVEARFNHTGIRQHLFSSSAKC